MTMTVKLDPGLEQRLRQRSLALGCTASDIIREALADWLDRTPDAVPSAHQLGADLFGRYSGPADLASNRKAYAAQAFADKNARRG